MPYKVIPLSKLLINKDNDRFEPSSNEKEAVNVMLAKMGSKIYRIAQHILDNGLSPKPFYVVSFGDKFLVKEGNRRTTAIKLMTRPNLIDSKLFPQLKKGFIKLNIQFKNSPITKIQCFVFDNITEADKWVKLEHTGEQKGIGIVNWNSEQIKRFDMKYGKMPPIEIQALDFLKSSPYTEDSTLNLLSGLKVTNLQRLLSDRFVREKLGLRFENSKLKSNIEESEIVKGLSLIINDITKPDFIVGKIYTSKLRADYINEHKTNSLPDLNQKVEKEWLLVDPTIEIPEEKNAFPSNNTKGSDKKGFSNIESIIKRKTLIPRSCLINITNVKVAKLYYELQRLDINSFTICSSIALRVFIELSVDTFLEKKGLLPEDKVSASKSGATLYQKVSKVTDFMAKKKYIDDTLSKGIKTITKDQNSIWGIDTIQAYLHNNQFSPSTETLLTTWDNIQEFMVTLWNNIEKDDA